MMVDSSAFIDDSLNPGLKHLKLIDTSGKTECFATVPLSWGQNCCCFHGCCGWCSLHSSLSAESVLASEMVRGLEGKPHEEWLRSLAVFSLEETDQTSLGSTSSSGGRGISISAL